MKLSTTRRGAAFLIAALVILSRVPAVDAGLIFSCASDNDLLRVASENGVEVKRFATPQAAVVAAGEGDGVLLLADGLSMPR